MMQEITVKLTEKKALQILARLLAQGLKIRRGSIDWIERKTFKTAHLRLYDTRIVSVLVIVFEDGKCLRI